MLDWIVFMLKVELALVAVFILIGIGCDFATHQRNRAGLSTSA